MKLRPVTAVSDSSIPAGPKLEEAGREVEDISDTTLLITI